MKPHNFELLSTEFGAVRVLKSLVFGDERGFFYESWREDAFEALGLPSLKFVQDNQSLSRRGVIRGLHWQGGDAPQGKLVRCVRGRIQDVVVDIRLGSPTFGKSYSVVLEEPSEGSGAPLDASARDAKMVYIPPGFAHGFLTLSESALVEYKCTTPWSKGDEGCLLWADPELRELGLGWQSESPILSDRDRAGMSLVDYRKRPAFHFEEKR